MTQTISININSKLLDNAQNYSRKMGSDLSHFIEMLLYQVLAESNKTESEAKVIKPINQLSPRVQSLCGVIKNTPELDIDIDGNEVRMERLKENL